MKAGLAWSLVFAVASYATSQNLDQHPLVGTWEMISVQGVDADGRPFLMDTTTARETKIITPTHYMLIACDVDGDSLIFNRTMAGKVAFDGDRYIETPTHSSLQILENVQVDFRWEVNGDIFIQSGKIIRPDGKEVVLDALKFRRLKSGTSYPKNTAVGTWHQTSGYRVDADGKHARHFDDSDAAMLIVTPTHWMRMDLGDKTFKDATFGSYVLQADSVRGTVVFSTDTLNQNSTFRLAQQVAGDTLKTTQNTTHESGATIQSHDIYRRAH